jgi:hypothetical protein
LAGIAAAVAETAYGQGLATQPQPEDVMGNIKALMYEPQYQNYV